MNEWAGAPSQQALAAARAADLRGLRAVDGEGDGLEPRDAAESDAHRRHRVREDARAALVLGRRRADRRGGGVAR